MTATAQQPTSAALEGPVRQIMRHGVVSIADDADLVSAFHAMGDHGVHAVLVQERASGRPLGWVTARSLLSWMNLGRGEAHAHQAVTERLVTALDIVALRTR